MVVVSPDVTFEAQLRALLGQHGYPLVCMSADGSVLVCSHGTWAAGRTLHEALEHLQGKLSERRRVY